MFWTRLASGVVLIIMMLLSLGFGGIVLTVLLAVASIIGWKELMDVILKDSIHHGSTKSSIETSIEISKTSNGASSEASTETLETSKGTSTLMSTGASSPALLGNPDRLLRNFGYLLGVLAIVAYYTVLYFTNTPTQYLSVIAIFILCLFLFPLFFYVFLYPKISLSRLGAILFSFVYVPVMLSFVLMTREMEQGAFYVWLILIGAWGSDTSAYCVGRLFGKRHIFPVLSPKKSLEGCIGGVLGAAFIGMIYTYCFVRPLGSDWVLVGWIALVCAVASIVGQIGDLAASAVKREHQIKDYGHLIPGHGGILDRFDSIITIAPIIFFFMLVVA
ncbi:MAG: phosphatidate cytidylyltransferase [Clostridium sp.]|jgi:phosphatidate cytidylyltransferase|nr:phosphatidate cytidylyltransferase [Clostridium sp.]